MMGDARGSVPQFKLKHCSGESDRQGHAVVRACALLVSHRTEIRMRKMSDEEGAERGRPLMPVDGSLLGRWMLGKQGARWGTPFGVNTLGRRGKQLSWASWRS